ncbi:MAG TPA: thioredoxin-dependent thiol peroxidase [Candidatus Nanoarchaeia archaeon]|nr:thioredoxin-dependent thiol peroxidase [Candidatus Nanoarchaeia archaeon]
MVNLKAGDKAPDFSAKDTQGNAITLSSCKGKPVVLYFYPKDDTPGCTKEACSFRDDYTQYKKKGIVILGVSTDDQESHQQFTKKYNLPFPLLVDTDKTIVNRYGVYGEKKMYGKKYLGTNRTTFLIDKEGKIQHIFKKVNVDEHSKEILEIKDK